MTAIHSPSDALTIEGLARWTASPDAVLLQRPGKAVLFDRLALRAIEVDEEAAALFRSFSEPRSLPSSGPSQQAAMALRDAGFLIRPGEAEERRRRATARYSTPPESTIDWLLTIKPFFSARSWNSVPGYACATET